MTPPPGRDLRELVGLVREGRLAAFAERAANLPPADLADVLSALSGGDRAMAVDRLPSRIAAHAIGAMSRRAGAADILMQLDQRTAVRIIAELDDAAAADLLGRLAPDVRAPLLAARRDPTLVADLLTHDVRTAGGLMTARIVMVGATDTAAFAIESVRRQAATVSDLSDIFVVDGARRLIGTLSVAQLLLADGAAQMRDLMTAVPAHVGLEEDQRVVAHVMSRYHLASVAVVDGAGRLVGRVSAADVRHIVIDEVAGGLLRFGGSSVAEGQDPRWTAAVRSRLPSLYFNLLTAFGSAAVVYLFRGSVLRIVTLAVWMPVVAGVGGNAGTQALAAAVRRFVMGDMSAEKAWRAVRRETFVGVVNGIAIGTVVAFVSVLLGESWKFGLVVFIAMVTNLGVASTIGAVLPLALRRAGRDPAHASPVVVTALTDACAFALLLGLATALLL